MQEAEPIDAERAPKHQSSGSVEVKSVEALRVSLAHESSDGTMKSAQSQRSTEAKSATEHAARIQQWPSAFR